MKKNWNFYKPIVITIIVLAIAIGCFCGVTYKCYHTENYLYYGNDDYCFVTVNVGSGRSHKFYCGVITVDDYNKWCDGESGTIFVYSTTSEGYGNRIRADKITSINNYGCKPDWLPMNFWY